MPIVKALVEFIVVAAATIVVERLLSTRAAIGVLCLGLLLMGWSHWDVIKPVYEEVYKWATVNKPGVIAICIFLGASLGAGFGLWLTKNMTSLPSQNAENNNPPRPHPPSSPDSANDKTPSGAKSKAGPVTKTPKSLALELSEELSHWIAAEREGWQKLTFEQRYGSGVSNYQKREAQKYEKHFGPRMRELAKKLKECGADTKELENAINNLGSAQDFVTLGVSLLVPAFRNAAYDIPGGQPECGTAGKPATGFREKDTGIYTIVIGGSAIGFWEDTLTNGPISPMKSDGVELFQLYVLNGHFYVDTKVFVGPGIADVEVRRNEIALNSTKNPAWDRNYTDNAVEIVNQNQIPMFQMIFETPRKVRINGVFRLAYNKLAVYVPGGSQLIELNPREPNQQFVVPLKPLFKYPSWKYPGKFVDEN